MAVMTDKYSMVAAQWICSGAPLRLPVEQPWPEKIEWDNGQWKRVAVEGFNVFVLMNAAQENAYISPFWLTLRDGEAAGGTLKPNAQGVAIASWRWSESDAQWQGDISAQNVESIEPPVEGAGADTPAQSVVAMRPVVVFNIQQWEGIDSWPEFVDRQVPSQEEALERAERIAQLGAGCEVRQEGGHAYYNPTLNYIVVPPKEFFKTLGEYYWVLFEQIGHALASKHQMDLWGGKVEGEMAKDPGFKSVYAKMVAAMLAYEAGIDVL